MNGYLAFPKLRETEIAAAAGPLMFEDCLWPGDVVHVQGSSWLSRVIRRATRDKDELPSWPSHTALVVGAPQGGDGTPLIIEAVAHVKIHPVTDFASPWIITRPPDKALVPVDTPLDGRHSRAALVRQRIAQHALIRAGRHYGWWKLPMIAGDIYLFAGRNVLRRFFFLNSYPICSWLVAEAFQAVANYRFLMKDCRRVDPDDVADDVTANGWQIVAASSADALESWESVRVQRTLGQDDQGRPVVGA